MSRYLDEILVRLKALAECDSVEIHKDWVQVVMSHFRQHLESKNNGKDYPVLMFYCNWNLHKDLERGIVQDMLEDIDKVITDEESGHPADRISEILSLSKLRLEIIKLLETDGAVKSGVFVTEKNWIAFTELMFPFILNKPLVKKREPKTHHWIEFLELYDNGGKLFWRIKTSPGAGVFIGPLLRTS